MRNSVIIFFIGICFSRVDIYEIKCMGLKVAECETNISDTLINDNLFIKLDYKVKSASFMKWFFNVNNQYITLIDNNNNIDFFSKHTSQPGLEDQKIKTIKENKIIKYENSNDIISKNECNIFSLLYLIASNKKDLDYVKLDREGKKYNCKVENIKDKYYLTIHEEDQKDFGVIKNTDIFNWALFLPETQKMIKINPANNKIEYCKFKKGLMTFTANRMK